MATEAMSPFERRDVDRADWAEIYWGMRRIRGRAIRWLSKFARVPRGLIASPAYLARCMFEIIVVERDRLECAALIRAIHPYSLYVPSTSWPDEGTVAWGLAALSVRVANHGPTRVRRTTTFDRHTYRLFELHGWRAWRMIEHFIAFKIISDWHEAAAPDEEGDRRRRFADLRQKWRHRLRVDAASQEAA